MTKLPNTCLSSHIQWLDEVALKQSVGVCHWLGLEYHCNEHWCSAQINLSTSCCRLVIGDQWLILYTCLKHIPGVYIERAVKESLYGHIWECRLIQTMMDSPDHVARYKVLTLHAFGFISTVKTGKCDQLNIKLQIKKIFMGAVQCVIKHSLLYFMKRKCSVRKKIVNLGYYKDLDCQSSPANQVSADRQRRRRRRMSFIVIVTGTTKLRNVSGQCTITCNK